MLVKQVPLRGIGCCHTSLTHVGGTQPGVVLELTTIINSTLKMALESVAAGLERAGMQQVDTG